MRATFKVQVPEDLTDLCNIITGIAGIDSITPEEITFTITDIDDEYGLGRLISDTEREIQALGNYRQVPTIKRFN